MGLAICGAMVGALALGLIGKRVFGLNRSDGDRGPSIFDILAQALTLAILLMAFVLVEAAASFSQARSAATAEADAVDKLFETAEYAGEPFREHITGKVVCYTRAILHFEWDQMDSGRAIQASVWSSGLRQEFKATYDAQVPLFDLLVAADADRSTARRDRLEVASPNTPVLVYALMLATLGVALAGYASSVPSQGGRTQLAALFVLSALLTCGLLLIRDLEQPFGGLASVASVEMTDVRDDISEDFVDRYGDRLPCDENGLKQ